MILASNNLVKNCEIKSDGENLQFPLSNLKDDRRTKVVKLPYDSSITFDFGVPRSVDLFMIVAAPGEILGVNTLTLQLNNVDSWMMPAVSVNIPLDEDFQIGAYAFPTVNEYRFARLVINSLSNEAIISKIFIGERANTSDVFFSYPLTYKEINNANKTRNVLGQLFIDEINTQKQLSGQFRTLNLDENDQVFELLDDSSETKPIWIYFDCENITNNNNRISGYYYLTDMPQGSFDEGNFWSYTFNLLEGT